MHEEELISQREFYESLRRGCDEIFDASARLPEKVFRAPFEQYVFFEHAHIYGHDFGEFLFAIASQVGDACVNYMSVEPDPVYYYFDLVGFYGLASFHVDRLKERYIRVMRRGGEADSFLARGGDVGVFWGSSLKWGLHCDRISWELCVLGLPRGIGLPKLDGLGEMDAEKLSGYIRSLYHWNPQKAEDFIRRLPQNYPI